MEHNDIPKWKSNRSVTVGLIKTTTTTKNVSRDPPSRGHAVCESKPFIKWVRGKGARQKETIHKTGKRQSREDGGKYQDCNGKYNYS